MQCLLLYLFPSTYRRIRKNVGKRASAFNLPVVHGSEVIKMLPGWYLQGAYVLTMSHVPSGAMP